MPGEIDQDRFLSKGKMFVDDIRMDESKPAPEVANIRNDLADFWRIDIEVKNNMKIEPLIRESMIRTKKGDTTGKVQRKYIVD